MRYILFAASAAALALALMAVWLQPAQAGDFTRPLVPDNIQVPAGNILFLTGHAAGIQDYMCLPEGSGVTWKLLRPEATLFDEQGDQIITHFSIPDPSGTARPAWQHSRDTSTVWAALEASSSDPHFVAEGAIPWFKLKVLAYQFGPTGGDKLARTTYIQRLNTTGGISPSTDCSSPADIGKRFFAPYTADYLFYRTGRN